MIRVPGRVLLNCCKAAVRSGLLSYCLRVNTVKLGARLEHRFCEVLVKAETSYIDIWRDNSVDVFLSLLLTQYVAFTVFLTHKSYLIKYQTY